MAEPRYLTIPVPVDGQDVDAAPEALPASRAPLVRNFLTDRPGRLVMRGPINQALSYYSSTAGPKPVGVWAFNDNLLIGKRLQDATAVRDPWVAPYRKASSANALSDADTTVHHIDLITGTLTNLAATAVNLVPGHSHDRVGDYVYGIGFDNASTTNENGGHLKLTQLIRWGGTAVAPTAYTNAPAGAQAVKAHYERLFVLGGRDPDGTGTIQQNTLWFSDPIGDSALTDAVASWQDDTSGLTNQIVVESTDSSDFGVALAKVGANLAIFKRRSIHVMLGYSPSTFTIRTFTKELGCIDPRSVVEHRDGVIFMSDEGLYWFDGAQLVKLDEGVKTDLVPKALAAVGDQGADGGYASVGRLLNDYVMVNIGTAASAAEAEAEPTFSGLLYMPKRSWSSFTSSAIVGDMPLYADRSSSRVFMLDENRIIQANKLTAPEQESTAQNRGIDSTDVLWTWTTLNEFTGAADTLENSDGLEMWPADQTAYAIPARWESKLIGLGFPFWKGQLQEVQLDYNFQVADDAADGLHDGWYVSVVDVNGTVLLPEEQVPSQGDPDVTNFPLRRRWNTDCFSETNEIQIVVEWRSDDPFGIASADLLQSHIVFQETRQRATD